SPVFISHPHFYNADPVLLDYVQGLSPNEDEHGLFIDIHPQTGVPLNVSIRLQLNLYMKKVSGITETSKISEVVMPMIWFEESGYIDGPILTTFHTNLVILPAVMEYMQYGFIALGLLTIIIAFLVHHRARRSKPGAASASTTTEERDPLLQEELD
ncbi:scavenger receptor class B member 1 isoform X3, partial [Solea senegalensis]